MAKSNEEQIIELIEQSQRIGLITHIDSDGDAFGSMLGLARIIETMGKEAVIFSSEPLLDSLDFLKEDITFEPKSEFESVDLLIGLDGNFFGRFTLADAFSKAKAEGSKLAIIDHHERSDVGERVDLYWGDPTISSASEMVYRISKALNLKLDKTTATLLLFGIETDTSSLQFENSKREAFLAVADLLNQGARLKPIVENAFGGKPLPVVFLLGRVMERARLTPDKLVVSYITLKDKEELKLEESISSGVANFIEQADESKAAVIFEEIEGGMIKVSLRSNNSDANVAKLANFFGGGGHKKAAGFKFKGKLSVLIPELKGK